MAKKDADGPTYDRDSVLPSHQATWPRYLRRTPVALLRIEGPFAVATPGGPFRCEDGYLGVDEAGYPFAVAVADVNQDYLLVPEEAEEAPGEVELYHPALDRTIRVDPGAAWVHRESGWVDPPVPEAAMPPASEIAGEQGPATPDGGQGDEEEA